MKLPRPDHGPFRRALLFGWLVVAAGCGTANMHLNRDYGEMEAESFSPTSYADRWGDPDEWTDKKVGSVLQTTMIWNCLDGEYREMIWRQHDPAIDGTYTWDLVADITREGECSH